MAGRMTRTGIDLGTGSVKLVRGEGWPRLRRITHLGVEPWDPDSSAEDAARAAAALKRLLSRLGLSRSRLGRIAVAAAGDQASVREVTLPSLTESDLRQALPFEARRHLALDVVSSPVLDFQILGPGPAVEAGGAEQLRVLLAAVSGSQREFCLTALELAGLEPEVIDLEPLSQLNALFATVPAGGNGHTAMGLLDIGGLYSSVHVGRSHGPVVTRVIGPGMAAAGSSDPQEHATRLAAGTRETLVFYRGRYRDEAAALYTTGGGALVPGMTELIAADLKIAVSRLEPVGDLAGRAEVGKDLATSGTRFTTACGLCRWWDEVDV